MVKVEIPNKRHGTQIMLIDECDLELFNSRKWFIHSESKTDVKYAQCTRKPEESSARFHRLVLGVSDSKLLVDHINGDGLDNRRCNLRICSYSENNRNARKKNKACTSEYKGVWKEEYRRGTKIWRAAIRLNTKRIYLGLFYTEVGAALAYNQAAVKYFGEFAVLNEITSNQED